MQLIVRLDYAIARLDNAIAHGFMSKKSIFFFSFCIYDD